MKASLFTILALPGTAHSLQVANIFKSFNPPAELSVGKHKSELLEAISFTGNGKTATPDTQLKVLDIVRSIETASPTSPNLLSDPKEAAILDGAWYLHYTSPSDPSLIKAGENDQFPDAWKPQQAEEKITTKQIHAKGSVSAAGITVDTSNRVVKQTLDVKNSIVTNEIDLDFGKICVGGPFRKSLNIPNRAVVSFDRADITLKNGLELKLGFLFDIRAIFVGTEEAGWLETTYVDSGMRIGRGNKGTMFVLTRNSDYVNP